MGERRNWKVTCTQSHLQQQIQLASTNHHSAQSDGGKWLVIDYRNLNKVTRKFIWPMSKVEDIFSKLNGAKYSMTLDLRAGYQHIPLDKSSILKPAFNSPFGKYEYVKVPFGLAQGPGYFQELMTGILKDFNFAIAYLDDIIIFSKTPEEHLTHIRRVFEILCSANLLMKLSKCHFFSKEIQYLGHILSTKGIWSCHRKCKPYSRCNHLPLLRKFKHFLVWSDITGNSLKILPKLQNL